MGKFVYIALLITLLGAGCSSPRPVTTENPRPELLETEAEPRGVEDDAGLSGTPYDMTGLPSQRIIYFDYDSSDIRPESRLVLEQHAAYLRANPMVNMRLEGHADERGTREYNLALGEQRGLAVQNILSILGVAVSQLAVLSYGEEIPAELGGGEAAWQLNRRVELIYPF